MIYNKNCVHTRIKIFYVNYVYLVWVQLNVWSEEICDNI
jgi:hypothetical protein